MMRLKIMHVIVTDINAMPRRLLEFVYLLRNSIFQQDGQIEGMRRRNRPATYVDVRVVTMWLCGRNKEGTMQELLGATDCISYIHIPAKSHGMCVSLQKWCLMSSSYLTKLLNFTECREFYLSIIVLQKKHAFGMNPRAFDVNPRYADHRPLF